MSCVGSLCYPRIFRPPIQETKSCRIKMRYSLACPQKSRTSPPALVDHPCNLTVCILLFSYIKSRREAKDISEYRRETHQQKHVRTYVLNHVLIRQHLLQHLQGVFQTFFSVLVCLSRLNCLAVWAFLRGEGDILRYTDIGRRAFPYTSPPYGPGKPQPIDGCWGVGRPALAVLWYCCIGTPLCPVL